MANALKMDLTDKESISSKEILARLSKNLDTVKRVLAITDIKDPALAKEVKEFFILKAEVTKLKEDLEAKELVMKSKLEKSIAPKLQEASDSLFRIEGTIYKFTEVSRTSVSYSDLYTMLLSKVNKQIQDMMATLKEELSKVSSYFKFEEIGEESDPKTIKKIMKEQEKKGSNASLEIKAGLWDKIKEIWNKLSGYLSSVVSNLTDSADEMEALVEEALGDVQAQEVEAGLKGIFDARG